MIYCKNCKNYNFVTNQCDLYYNMVIRKPNFVTGLTDEVRVLAYTSNMENELNANNDCFYFVKDKIGFLRRIIQNAF